MLKAGDVLVNPRTGQTMKFLKTARDTTGECLQIDCTSKPTGIKEPEHIHPRQVNRCEILSGSLVFSINGKEQKVNSGENISIPPNTPHYFWNAGDKEAHYIQEFQPALNSEQFFETLFRLASEGKLDKDGKPGMLQAAVFVPAFWDEIRVTQPPQALQRIFFALLNPVSRLLGVKGV